MKASSGYCTFSEAHRGLPHSAPAANDLIHRHRRTAKRLAALGVVFWFGAVASFAKGQTAETSPVLTRAAQVLALSEEQAARSLPIRLHGVVIGESPPIEKSFVLWDQSDYIYVRNDAPGGVQFQRGDAVDVEGHSGAGGFSPLLYMTSGRKEGVAPIPPPRTLRFEEMMGGQFDAQWVRVHGIVRRCEPAEAWAGRFRLTLAVGGSLLVALVNADMPIANLVDAEVTLDGLLFNQHNQSRQFVGALLFVPAGVPIAIDAAAPEAPFATPARSVASLLQFERNGRYGHRVHVRGEVVQQLPGECLWIRDGSRGLRVASRSPEIFAPGDQIAILGFATSGDYTPRLEDAIFQKTGAGPAPKPVIPDDFLTAIAHDSDLVAIQGAIVEIRRTPTEAILLLDWQGRLVPAMLPLRANEPIPSALKPGCQVQAAGICTVLGTEPMPSSGTWDPRGFELRLRDAADVSVLGNPSWWTRRRLLWAAVYLSGGSILAIAGVVLAARRRVRDQKSQRLKAEAEFSAILNERNRLAREIHDTLAQGMAAVSMQIELAKAARKDDKPALGRYLDSAHEMLRGTLAEARASIWKMRSQLLENEDLAGAIETVLHRLAADLPVQTRFTVIGNRRRLAPVTENELLRIAQEAITNAIKHAKPRAIDITLGFAEKQVQLAVTDDGTGFDVEQASSQAGHYGIAGLRERATELGATLKIDSSAGRGTRIEVIVPTAD